MLLASLLDRIELVQAAQEALAETGDPGRRRIADAFDIAPDEVEKIVYRAVLDGECPIHVGFAERQLRQDGKAELTALVVNADGDGRTGIAFEQARPSLGVDQGEATDDDQPIEQ